MTLEIIYKTKDGEVTNMWRLKNTRLKNHWINEQIKGEIKKYLKTNDNETTTKQLLWDAVLRRKFIAIQTQLNKQETYQISNLKLHLKEPENEEQMKPKVSRMREIIKIRAEINEIETKKTLERINETKSWFFEKTETKLTDP